MNKIFQKISQNNFVFASLVLSFCILPAVLKLLLTGSIGPDFKFYFIVLWLPVVIMSFSALRSHKGALLSGVLLISAFIISIVNYPLDPAMDFRRQITHHLDAWIILAVLVSLTSQIAFPRLET